MILDLDKRQLRYIVNGNDYGVAYENIEATSYRACISGYCRGNSYKLLCYQPR